MDRIISVHLNSNYLFGYDFLPVQVRHKQDQQRLENLRNSKLILNNIIENINIHAHAHVNIYKNTVYMFY